MPFQMQGPVCIRQPVMHLEVQKLQASSHSLAGEQSRWCTLAAGLLPSCLVPMCNQ